MGFSYPLFLVETKLTPVTTLVCQGFPVQKPSISAPNVLPKSLEKVLGKDLFLDLLVVLWLEKTWQKLFPKWWSPFNGRFSWWWIPMVENTHDLKQTNVFVRFFGAVNSCPLPPAFSTATLPFISLRGGISDSVALELATPVSKVLPWGRILGKQKLEVGGDLMIFGQLQIFETSPMHSPKKKARNQKCSSFFFGWGGKGEGKGLLKPFVFWILSALNISTLKPLYHFGFSVCRDENTHGFFFPLVDKKMFVCHKASQLLRLMLIKEFQLKIEHPWTWGKLLGPSLLATVRWGYSTIHKDRRQRGTGYRNGTVYRIGIVFVDRNYVKDLPGAVHYCWWQPEILHRNQLRMVSWHPIKLQGFIYPTGGWPWDFWTTNSMGGSS